MPWGVNALGARFRELVNKEPVAKLHRRAKLSGLRGDLRGDRFGRSDWRMLHSSMAGLWFGLNTPLDGRQRPDEVRACDALYSLVACYR
jgi:hypothetical protein